MLYTAQHTYKYYMMSVIFICMVSVNVCVCALYGFVCELNAPRNELKGLGQSNGVAL